MSDILKKLGIGSFEIPEGCEILSVNAKGLQDIINQKNETLEALIKQTLEIAEECLTGEYPERTIEIIEKETKKRWKEIKELLND